MRKLSAGLIIISCMAFCMLSRAQRPLVPQAYLRILSETDSLLQRYDNLRRNPSRENQVRYFEAFPDNGIALSRLGRLASGGTDEVKRQLDAFEALTEIPDTIYARRLFDIARDASYGGEESRLFRNLLHRKTGCRLCGGSPDEDAARRISDALYWLLSVFPRGERLHFWMFYWADTDRGESVSESHYSEYARFTARYGTAFSDIHTASAIAYEYASEAECKETAFPGTDEAKDGMAKIAELEKAYAGMAANPSGVNQWEYANAFPDGWADFIDLCDFRTDSLLPETLVDAIDYVTEVPDSFLSAKLAGIAKEAFLAPDGPGALQGLLHRKMGCSVPSCHSRADAKDAEHFADAVFRHVSAMPARQQLHFWTFYWASLFFEEDGGSPIDHGHLPELFRFIGRYGKQYPKTVKAAFTAYEYVPTGVFFAEW